MKSYSLVVLFIALASAMMAQEITVCAWPEARSTASEFFDKPADVRLWKFVSVSSGRAYEGDENSPRWKGLQPGKYWVENLDSDNMPGLAKLFDFAKLSCSGEPSPVWAKLSAKPKPQPQLSAKAEPQGRSLNELRQQLESARNQIASRDATISVLKAENLALKQERSASGSADLNQDSIDSIQEENAKLEKENEKLRVELATLQAILDDVDRQKKESEKKKAGSEPWDFSDILLVVMLVAGIVFLVQRFWPKKRVPIGRPLPLPAVAPKEKLPPPVKARTQAGTPPDVDYEVKTRPPQAKPGPALPEKSREAQELTIPEDLFWPKPEKTAAADEQPDWYGEAMKNPDIAEAMSKFDEKFGGGSKAVH